MSGLICRREPHTVGLLLGVAGVLWAKLLPRTFLWPAWATVGMAVG